MYYDKDGKPLELMEWAVLCQDERYRRIDFTVLPRGYAVSTVWMGLNHNVMGEDNLTIFETAILKDGRFLSVFERCDTLANAMLVHTEGIKAVRKRMGYAKYLKRMARR